MFSEKEGAEVNLPANEFQAVKSRRIWNWLHSRKKPNEKAKDEGELDAKYIAAPKEDPFEGLDENETRILKEQVHMDEQKSSFFVLFKFARPWDLFLLMIAVFFAIVHGVALPMFTLVVGSITNNFRSFLGINELDVKEFRHQTNHNAKYFVYIGLAIIVSGAIESYLFVDRGEILAGRYRKAYMRSVIRQNIGFFDKMGSGEVATRITNDCAAIQEAISEKIGTILAGIATFITAICISLAVQWKLALIMLSVVFYMFISMTFSSLFMMKYIVSSENTYSRGSTIAEEAFSAVRSTIAFGVQNKLVEKFDDVLKRSMKIARKSDYFLAGLVALTWAGLFLSYALSYWEGSRIIASLETSIGKVITVIIAMMIGSFQIGNIAPMLRFIVKGIGAAKQINETICREPIVDSMSDQGIKLDHIEGNISLKHVKFRYPSRPNVLVLPDFSLEIKVGQTVALVGSSGSGKSTIVGILERFYLPISGSVTIDGVEIDKMNLRWLRQQIGYVPQEPTLFAVSIYENIAYGMIGTELEHADEETKMSKVIEACKQSNAWDFIQNLTDGLNTNVGDRGFLMSGGQKQRLAIARAIVSDPKILLLDEATSALDTKSEGIVQEALDRAAKNRTTIVIAHRLSTVKDADNIVVMSKGRIVEQGTHQELLAQNGYYAELVSAQQVVQHDRAGHIHEIDRDSNYAGSQLYESAPSENLSKREDSLLSIPEDELNHKAINIPGMKTGKIAGLLACFKLVLRLNKKEHKQMILGTMGSIVVGYSFPSLAMVTAKIIQATMVPVALYPKMRHSINALTGYLFMIGIIVLVAAYLMMVFHTFASGRLVRQVRLQLFRQLLRMDIAFYDLEENSPGSLMAVLAVEAKAIEGLGGATLGQILQCSATLFGGIATGIPFNWRIGLVATACVPILIGCGFGRVRVLNDLNERARRVYEESAALASQYASAVRTVQSLTREDGVVETYSNAIDRQIRGSRFATARSSIFYGFSQGLNPWVVALIFWYGSKLMSEGKINVFGYYVVFMAIILGAQAAGQIFSYAPDMGKARHAAANVYRILNTTPLIDVWSDEGDVIPRDEVQGNIDFEEVQFTYPTRPLVPVLRGLNLKIRKGQYVALVGPSGCGKSTTIGLIERFYDVIGGQVLFDGRDIRSFNLKELRAHMALVQQEPVLYSGTIRDNIMMGWVGDPSEVTEEMIHEVCRKANIHDFIISLPDGYDTISGSRGSMLSGGQKQRVAIARALIRDPKVLLLDEATSALDSESEKVVQAALDEAAKGRTTIAVAHRLSTIQNADVIYVFEGGKIVEEGTHKELLNINGRYAELVRLQSLER